MSVRTWDAGRGQNITLFVFVMIWGLFIWFGIATTSQYDLPTIIGLIFVGCVLVGWITFFIRGQKPMVQDESRIDT